MSNPEQKQTPNQTGQKTEDLLRIKAGYDQHTNPVMVS
jgi:hypothetical protein